MLRECKQATTNSCDDNEMKVETHTQKTKALFFHLMQLDSAT